LFDVTGRSNVTKYSFIAPRSKKTTLSITTWLIIALVSLIVVFSVIYFMMDKKEEIPQQKENNLEKIKVEEKETPQKSKVIKEIQLPDHGTNNQEMVTLIKKIFDTIDEKSVLKEIQIQEDESTMICDFFTPKAQEKFINKSILEVYEKSEVVLMSSNNDVLTTIVSNNTLLDLPKQESKHYTKSQQTFMDDLASHKFLQELLGNDITIVFEDEIISKYSTQIFSITANIKEPVHFYKIMDVINNQNYSITLDYPIEFIKTNETLEVTFVLNINQTLPNKDK
jgi:Ca2+/Na+ antiporter